MNVRDIFFLIVIAIFLAIAGGVLAELFIRPLLFPYPPTTD